MIKSLKTTNFSNNFRVVSHYLLLFGVVLFFSGIVSSCTKKPTEIGKNLIQDSTLTTAYTDTFAIQTYSEPFDSVYTTRLGSFILGSFSDQVFGSTQSDFYAQVAPIYGGVRFGSNPVPDSLILQMNISGIYGDTTSVLNMHVYEMSQDIYYDSAYYSNWAPTHNPNDYADFSFTANKSSNNYILNGDTIADVIHINLSKINPGLAYKLLQIGVNDPNAMDSTSVFLDDFKGLYFTADKVSGNGALVSFSPTSTLTTLTLYYHNDSTGALSYGYIFGGSSTTYGNHYVHQFNQGESQFTQQVVQQDTLLGQQKYYVQGLAGVKTVIKFPNIKKLAREGKIGINEAKLILPGSYNAYYYGAPATLSLVKVVSDTSFSALTDQSEGTAYFGGTYDSLSNSYQFRITHYIQSLVSDTTQENKGLTLYISGGTLPQRFIFNGPEPVSDTLSRTKLELLYTKFN